MSFLQSFARKLTGRGRRVDIVVSVPEETPPGETVYLTGACEELGQWGAPGKPLKQTDAKTWETRIYIPADQDIEFKVTRGSWDNVERHADGADTGNHFVPAESLAEGPVRHKVERWADVA